MQTYTRFPKLTLAQWREFQKKENLTDAQLAFLLRNIDAERAKHDLFYLAKEILGYSDLTESIHRPLCQLIESVNPLIISQARAAEIKSIPKNSTERGRQLELIAHRKHVEEWNRAHPDKRVEIDTDIGTDMGTNMDINIGININCTRHHRHDAACGGGVGGGKVALDPTQNFIKKFSLPDIESVNRLRRVGIIDFNEDARTRLFLLFRGAFKSTIITIAHTIQLMLLWPDIRILIASHKKEGGSQKFLGAIKEHFIRNDRFRELFPDYCPKPNTAGQIDWGTSEQVTLPNRKANFPESTIEIAGNTTDVTGRHYNYLKIDDIVTRESVTNEQMLERTQEFNALLTFLFDQPEWGIADYAGTCYHFADLYSSLRNSPQITKFILPVWDEKKVPTIPERFTTDGIEQIRNHPSMTSYQFSAQYLMNPVPQEDQTFRPEYWKKPGFYYDRLPNDLRIYVLVDPANKQRKESDYTALMTIGIDGAGDIWLIDIIRDKLTLDGRAKLVCETLMKNNIHLVHYESVGFQSSDIKAIREMGSQRDWYIAVNEIKATRQSKEDRIRGLQYYYEQGKVHWPKSYMYFSKYHNRQFDMVEVLQREMWMFPSCEKDDLCDVQSFILRTAMTKSSTYTPKQNIPDAWDFWMQTVRDAKKKPSGTFTGNQKGFREIPSKKSWR